MTHQAQVQRKINPKKIRSLQRITSLAEDNPVVMISGLQKVRAAQLLALRKNFRGRLHIVVAKNRLAQRALGGLPRPHIEEFVKSVTNQNVLMFTHMNPFEVSQVLENARVNLPARAGDVAPAEIVVSAGNTGIPPGPVLSDFKEAGVATKIDQGTIWVAKDTVVARPGNVITPKLAGLLSKLGLKPIMAGLSISKAYWNGLIIEGRDLLLDIGAYKDEIVRSFRSALDLAVVAGYPTPDSLPMLISKSHMEAAALVRASGYPAQGMADEVLRTAGSQALNVLNLARAKGYSPS